MNSMPRCAPRSMPVSAWLVGSIHHSYKWLSTVLRTSIWSLVVLLSKRPEARNSTLLQWAPRSTPCSVPLAASIHQSYRCIGLVEDQKIVVAAAIRGELAARDISLIAPGGAEIQALQRDAHRIDPP